MIAASDPLEYIPRGRQQVLRHPGPVENPIARSHLVEADNILFKFERVSLADSPDNEWWTVRRTPSTVDVARWESKQDVPIKQDCNRSHSAVYKTRYSDATDDISFKTSSESSFNKFGKRMSDASTSEGASKKISVVESDHQYTSMKGDDSAYKSRTAYPKFRAKSDLNYMEDELYVKGHTVIWSRGLLNNFDNLDNSRRTICCYTTSMPVRQALWCKFYWERPVFVDNLMNTKINEPSGTPMDAICITDSHNIKVFTSKGEDFTVAIPFFISKLWNTKFGIFIEKEDRSFLKENIYETPSVLYSLSYPLDDVCPVAANHSNVVTILNNSSYKVVFTSAYPSICMIYDSSMRQHSVYKIRKLKATEVDFSDRTTVISLDNSNKLKNRLSMWDNIVHNQNIPPVVIGQSKSIVASNLPSRSPSSMALMSRCQSVSGSFQHSPWMPQSSKTNNSIKTPISTKSYFDFSKTASYLRSNPELCLEHLWTDNSTQNTASVSAASKVFLVDDLAGQWYLCYIITTNCQLTLVKINFSNPNHITFGLSMSIGAKDAEPIPHLHMVAIMEHSGNITIYSGLMPVGKLHVGGTLARHTPSPYVKRQMPKGASSPVIRRSSLLPHLSLSDPKFDGHLLSPVLPTTSNFMRANIVPEYSAQKSILCGITDAVEDRITLKYSDGTFYRITLPSLVYTTLVESCLTALRQVLQSDASMVLLTRWYAAKNVIGCHLITPCEEWDMFTGLLFELLGYEEDQTHVMVITPSPDSKKHKHSFTSDEHWKFLRGTSIHGIIENDLERTLQITENRRHGPAPNRPPKTSVNPHGVLFPYIRVIHFTLHLLYEDLKLNTLRAEELPLLMSFLKRLSSDLGLQEYKMHYWRDFPFKTNISKKTSHCLKHTDLKGTFGDSAVIGKPVSVMDYIYMLLKEEQQEPFPYLPNVNNRTRDILQLCGVLSYVNHRPTSEVLLGSFVKEISMLNPESILHDTIVIGEKVLEQFVLMMVDMKITTDYMDTLPFGIYYILYDALWKCRKNPSLDWPVEAYYLLWREDLAAQALKSKKSKQQNTNEPLCMYSSAQIEDIMSGSKMDPKNIDGMEDIDNSLTNLRFNEDVRVNEARKMLQSSKPAPIVLTQRPDVSDHDFIEEQERHLYGICIRTMALPIGRGMFTLRTATPVITEPLPAPPLCLTGKSSPRGVTVDLNHIDTPPNMNMWPLFHNGVANGLRITPDAHNIDNTWIIFNKSKGGDDLQMEHAGFLLALGLNGHLRNLALNSTFSYLEKLHEMTSVGVLLGLSAAFRGTCHSCLTKTLSIHVEALLPPTSMEVDVPQNLQVAGVLGIGLLYQQTAHRHMTEMLLSEIGRPPGPEMENSIDRESYSLAAGLSLGLVTLKYGESPAGLSDLNIPDTLHYYMVGGNRRPITGSQTDRYRTPSFQIREGSSVNLDVTAPGATLALGLMYLGTGNKAIADWMAPPQTQYLLDFVRPDFLLLRILSRSLIMWNSIEPTKEWIENQVPSTIRPYCMVEPNASLNIDYEAMNQAYCNIVAGACFALGLKFAGTADVDAFEALFYFCKMFTSLMSKSIAELAGKSTIETCLNVLLLSGSMVMAGTGNLDLMRLIRHLRRRVGVSNSPIVTYGSHLATHMALGLLFLGGGRYTLSNSPTSVAALICAFYPKFPTHSNDNRYHLQAFRHLYVLAVELRLVIPKEVNTAEICYANLKVVKMNGATTNMKAPCIIPDLNTLAKISVDDERYWPVTFQRGRNWELLEKILSTTGNIEVKQRAGCLSYMMDRFGYRSELAQTLTLSEDFPWDPSPEFITMFTSDKTIKLFCEQFLSNDNASLGEREEKLKQALCRITYEAVVKDKLIIITVFMSLAKMILEMELEPMPLNLWQFKLVMAQIFSPQNLSGLIRTEVILSLHQQIINILESWEDDLKILLRKYLQGDELVSDMDDLRKLACYVNFYDYPHNTHVCPSDNILTLFMRMKKKGKVDPATVMKIANVLGAKSLKI